jgi:CheY-like chemotaxis protein
MDTPDPEPRRAVLVAEDQPLVRFFLVDVFEDAGFDVVAVNSADEALLQFDRGVTVDVVVSDIEMPGKLNGIGLARWLSENYPSVRVILISGRIFPGNDKLPQGTTFLRKPVSSQTLLQHVHRLTEGASR